MNKEEMLLEFMQSEHYAIIIDELQSLAEAQSNDVLKLSLDSVTDRELLVKKARSEGAERLVSSFTRRLQSLKSKRTDGK